MDCRMIRDRLTAYHFATCGEQEQRDVEEHLVACTGCLRDYLLLKHHIETGSWQSQAPSSAVRDRLRRDVQAAFPSSRSDRIGQWLRTPIPLYQGMLAAAIILLVAGSAPAIARWWTATDTMASSAQVVDTSRSSAAVVPLY